MPAAVLNLVIGKGEDVTFTGTHQVSETDATPVDLTGWTILVTVKDHIGRTTLFTETGTPANQTTNRGQFTWSLSSANTSIASRTYAVDVWRTDAGFATLMAIGVLDIDAAVLNGR